MFSDVYINRIREELDNFDIISIDIFDTILFRMCEQPKDVFYMVAETLCDKCESWNCAPESYVNIRTEAENRARGKKEYGKDCTFEEIISELPFDSSINELLKEEEIRCEEYVLFLNENMRNFIVECKEKDKVILLISDMYHSSETIKRFLLSSGFDITLVDGIYVSSECDAFKFTGELFEKAYYKYSYVERKRILHIGDNEKADIAGSKTAGISSILYPITNQKFGDLFQVEQSTYNVKLGELNALRRLTNAKNPESPFFSLGAQIIGPLYSMYAEWIVNRAIQNNIRIIIPFMREGTLLGKVINNVISEKRADIECKPAYISRKPVFIASIYEDNYEERIKQELLRGNRSARTIFDEIGLSIPKQLDAVADKTLNEIRKIGKIALIEDYLYNGKTKEKVINYAKNQRNYLIEYLDILTGNEKKIMTVDIGSKGTTEKYLHDITEYSELGYDIFNSIMFGDVYNSIVNIFKGLKLSAWLGLAGQNSDLLERLKQQIIVIESFVNDVCGSTIKYTENVCSPILEAEILSESDKQKVYECWQGVEYFQQYIMRIFSKKDGLKDSLLKKNTEFIKIWLRLIDNPSYDEARYLGNWIYWDSYNQNKPTRLTGENTLLFFKESERQVLSDGLSNGVYWPQAKFVLQNPDYPLTNHINSLNDDTYVLLIRLINKIKEKNLKCGVTYCASEVSRKLCILADNMDISIINVVDSDSRTHGNYLQGREIVGIEDIDNDIVEFIVIGTYVYENEIRAFIDDIYSKKKTAPIGYWIERRII